MTRWRDGLTAGVLVLATSCALPRPATEAVPASGPDRRHAVYVAAGMAGLNHPDRPTGDDDNLAGGVGARLAIGPVSLRPEVLFGDRAAVFTPSVTYDFALLGRGPGSIDGNVGLGASFLTEERNQVLGNANSPFLRVGAEGNLAVGVLAGAALMLAPWGYEQTDPALAGVVYAGLRF
ncbi:MAG: hypothetical protein AAF628_11640 [Planctomycetota bacterium]